MDEAAREALEASIRSAADRGDIKGAVTLALSSYGPEIFGYLLAVLRDEQRAEDVYSDFAEDVVRGMPAFRFESSARTWLYTIARHACSRHLAREQRKRTVALSAAPEALDIVATTRVPTPPYVRTGVREGIERLRKTLKPDDQTLLILRVDRNMAWLDIAQILAGPERKLSEADLRASAARLRKRFERLKDRLRDLARAEKLIGDDGES